MTPERLAEIRERVTYNPEDWPITIELVAQIDSLTAEIDRLKGEVQRLNTKLNHNRCNSGHETLPLVLWDCPVCHQITKDENATLRTKLDALVKAFTVVNESKVAELVDNGECAADGEPLMDEMGDYIVDANDWDALSAAVKDAKEGK